MVRRLMGSRPKLRLVTIYLAIFSREKREIAGRRFSMIKGTASIGEK
jgi:hypothetical protein